MPDESILSDAFIHELINVGEVDILVGLPTYNDGQTVGQVVQGVRAGLLKYFPRARSVIINADGGSRDGTQDLVRAASISDISVGSGLRALRTLHSISTQYVGGPSAGQALRTILAAADLLQAKACVIVSPESTTLEPEWMDRLLQPLLRDSMDLVLPVYKRQKFDGLLIRNLVYPLTRAVFRCPVREPYPSEFAVSGSLGSQFLQQDIWTQEPGQRGAELWMTLSAVVQRCKIGQSFLGAKSRPANVPSDLVNAMRGTAGVLFGFMESAPSSWNGSREPLDAPCNGCQTTVSVEALRVNRKRLHQMFVFGMAELEPVFLSILSPATHAELKRLAALPDESFVYPPELWARTVYEFTAAYHKAVIGRDHIVQALVPLFRGKAFTFVTQNREASAEEVESNIELVCQAFEHEKPYLTTLWDGGK